MAEASGQNRSVAEKLFRVEYSSNNSGGDWWLKDKDWKALEEAGWCVHWKKDSPYESIFGADEIKKTGRWLGALATNACITVTATNDDEAEDIAQGRWENITGMNAYEEGCNCCGRPHSFYAESKLDCEWKSSPIDTEINSE